METVSEEKEASSRSVSGFFHDVINGSGKVGEYIYDILNNTFYYTGKCSSHIFNKCKHLKISICEKVGKKGGVTIKHLVKNDAAIDDAAKKDFYMRFGRDIVELTKSDIEKENLTIIDVSKYKL